ncbi:MAG TPA: pitrilysin family protein [Vicinamibacterales bacterium]|jgi:zinc protease|nr:pitrilysin family protein [Vicinamibacterales bacterium]
MMARGLRALAAVWLGAAILWVAVPPLAAAVRPPKLQYEITTLPNGMTLVTSEDHSTPIVHLNLTYHVGSKNEKPGRTGFAHLFEHLMFKGSKNVLPEAHTSYVASVGGQSNAYTTDDETVFWETVPSQYLPMILWLEADRMATLRIDKDTFTNEREVVKEERRMRVDNQPYGRLNEIIYDQAFTVHPYKHATIGSMVDLEAASVEDVRDFYRTYYVPSNATLVLVGDFDSAQAAQLVNQYIGRVPKAERDVPRDIPKEPPQTKEKRVTLPEPWPLPAVVVAYHITYDGNPDSYPLHIAAKVLSDGQSSRIYKKLVYEKQMAVAAFGSANLIEDPNLFYAVAVVQPGHTTEEVATTLIAEIDRLKADPISEHELQRTKNQFARDYILGRESNQQKASVLAHAVVIHNDIKTADGEFDIFQNITVADVQRVARTYFRPENRMVLTLMPNGRPGGQ